MLADLLFEDGDGEDLDGGEEPCWSRSARPVDLAMFPVETPDGALCVSRVPTPPCWSRSERPVFALESPLESPDLTVGEEDGFEGELLAPMLLPPSREPGPRPNPPGSAATVFTEGAEEAPVEEAGAGVVEGFEGLAPVLLPPELPGICHGPRGSLGLLGPRPLPWLPLSLFEPDCVSP